MKLDSQSADEDEPIRPNSIVPPLRKGSNAIRFRIFTLIGMLFLVIYAMIEAGNPDNWKWLGFAEPNPSVTENETSEEISSEVIIPESQFVSPANSDKLINRNADNSTADSNNVETELVQLNPELGSIHAQKNELNDFPKFATRFWHSIIQKLKPEQQSTFIATLKKMRRGEKLEADRQVALKPLLKGIIRNRERFQQELFDQLALATEGSGQKAQLSTDLFAAKEMWDSNILPALDAASKGEDFTLSQLQAIHRLQTAIDPALFDQVQDNTAIGWTGDSAAWKRLWEKVIADSNPDATLVAPPSNQTKFEPVTRIQLMSQPDFYRGKRISIEGWVQQAAQERISQDSEIGIDKRYILWIRPKDTKQGTYCVYTHKLPSGFPELAFADQQLNVRVKIDGYFFKVRTYRAQGKNGLGKTVETCPVVLNSNLASYAPVEAASRANWTPSRATLIVAFLMMPLVAGVIAWLAFRASQTKPYRPGQKTAKKIDKSLKDLTKNPNVQTDREKIMALYDSDDL